MYYGSGFVVVYKHFDRSLHIWVLDPTCVQSFRPVPLTVFEIQGLKMNNNNNRKQVGKEGQNICSVFSKTHAFQRSSAPSL